MSNFYSISHEALTIDSVESIIKSNKKLQLSDAAKSSILKCRQFLDDHIKNSEAPVYGINTGFGSLYSKNISRTDLEQLQTNLVMSHACGTGAKIDKSIVKIMLLLKIQSLAYGHSGVQLTTVERLIEFFNNDILPVIYEAGSLGASGDLAPLAHLSLPLLGKGEVYFKNEKISGEDLLSKMNWEPIHLRSKEGLALLNGTQFMNAFATQALIDGRRIFKWANFIGATSLDAFDGRIDPFDEKIHQIRKQNGQIEVAKEIRSILADSQIIKQPKRHVQDPYSFRCIPQVHGATFDAIKHCENVISAELAGVTDNPNIFPEEGEIISGGNFHGQPLAITMDFLAIALAELGNISERRTYQLISGLRGLPDFLVMNPGLNSGLMIPQYSAASLVSQNKQLCTPASVDSIVSSNGQEDHVSMGANSATKLYKIVHNLYQILAIEMITASQALDFREPSKSSSSIQEVLNNFRKEVPLIKEDRILHDDIIKAEDFLKNYSI
ncbi:histidine ammonia-lyase [Marivirga atlantica]|jgi:histidine ammonia-lyase|uniref:Histidine ammonia-lyase n=1 Tax=Marivirga atlantica TaxID=1548457 RepID=A0A937AH72_9BACT|nr:histidine ammonia-lyase [Marivirga atlantica]MBL0766148.1 histidine ammonia-lyase [Marivirga atlantica]